MFDKAIVRANIRDAGFSFDDTCALLEGLNNSKDESEFRSFVTNMRFTGDYRVVYDSDAPWYKALSCIPW
jgi:hypothetical protein